MADENTAAARTQEPVDGVVESRVPLRPSNTGESDIDTILTSRPSPGRGDDSGASSSRSCVGSRQVDEKIDGLMREQRWTEAEREADDENRLRLVDTGGRCTAGRMGQPRLRHDPMTRIPPFLIAPERLEPTDEPLESKSHPAREWLPRKLLSTPWLTLFYDLIMVAVLNVFSADHEIDAPEDLGTFFSYFVIIWWIWMSQVAHDIRFQTDDLVHRAFRLLQLCTFLYMGAAGNTWSPAQLHQTVGTEGFPSDEEIDTAVSENGALDSFQLVSVTYGASRAVLGVQYLLTLYLARRAHRPLASLALPCAGALASGIFAAIAAALSPTTSRGIAIAKPVMLYLGIGIEAAVEIVTPGLKSYIRPASDALSDRLGSLTLIILGEGFISTLRAVDLSINSFTRSDGLTYLGALCVVVIGFMIWIYYFGYFEPRHYVGKKRSLIWAVLHFPLHFAILVLIAGMTNSLRYRGFATGTIDANNKFLGLYNQNLDDNFTDLNATDVLNMTLTPVQERKFALQLGGLPTPTFIGDMFYNLNNALNATSSAPWVILFTQYLSQIAWATATTLHFEMPSSLQVVYTDFIYTNYTQNNISLTDDDAENATAKYYEIYAGLMTVSLEGTLWLLPAAGITLVFLGLLGLWRYQFRDSAVMYGDFAQIAFGACVSLLGLLAIGQKHVEFDSDSNDVRDLLHPPVTPLYRLVNANWLLPIVAALYGLFWIINASVLFWVRRRRRRQQQAGSLPALRPPQEEKAPLAGATTPR